MPERKKRIAKDYNNKMRRVGFFFREKRLTILDGSREAFISNRSSVLFDNEEWISSRYLANIESGKNIPSIEMLIKLSFAYEIPPTILFENIYEILYPK